MRKSTKNTIIHGILIIFVIFFAIIASVTAALRDVTVQCMIARSAATELSKKLNADVRIKTFYITNDGTICVENVQVNDLYGYPLFKIGELNAKLTFSLNSNELRFRNIVIKDILGNIVVYEGDEKPNVTELFAQLKSNNDDKDKDNDLNLKVDKFQLENGHFVFWNQNKDDPERKGMDYAHIDVDSIYGVFSNLEMRRDSVMGMVHSLKGKDQCGLVLNNISGDVLFCEKCLKVDSLNIKTGESYVDIDTLRFYYENSRAFYDFINAVDIKANIRESTMLLSDLKYFAWVMEQMPDKMVFTCNYSGPIKDFTVNDLDLYYGDNTHLQADVSLTGLPVFYDTYFDVDIKSLTTSYDDIVSVAIPSESVTVPLPEMLSGLGCISTSGSFQGYAQQFNTAFVLNSEIGDINAQVFLKTDENAEYAFNIDANDVKINEILKNNDLTDVTLHLDLNGGGLKVEDTDFTSVLNIRSLKFRGNEFNDIEVYGDFDQQRLNTTTIIGHRFLSLYMESGIDFNHEMPEFSLNAMIKDADLVNLHLSDFDTVMLLSSNIDLRLSGNDVDNLLGNLEIINTHYNNGHEYCMKGFHANVNENSGVKEIDIDCDFFNFEGSGIVCFKELVDVLKNNVIYYFDIPSWNYVTETVYQPQEFSFGLIFKDTRQLAKLFMPKLYIASGTEITASYTNLHSYHSSSIESPEIVFNGLKFKNLDIRNNARYSYYESEIKFEDIILRDTTASNPDPISLENVNLKARCANDTINVNLKWNDDDLNDHNKALIKSIFTRDYDDSGILYIKADSIMINDSVWNINRDCSIVFNDNGMEINKLMMRTTSQSMALNGHYPKTDADTLTMVFNNVNVSNFDFITLGYNLDFDGVIDGLVGISGLNEHMTFFSNLDIGHLVINKQEVGELSFNTSWDDILKSIKVNSDIYKLNSYNERICSARLKGDYYTQKKKDNLDFKLKFDKFKLATVSPFLSSVVSRMSGIASGNITVKGSTEEPIVIGKMTMQDAACSVNILNTYYTFSDEIMLTRDKIIFDDLVMNDTLGNQAVVNGYIGHNYLRDFTFDIDIQCDDFLALNIPPEKAMGFYGTAVTDGTVKIQGPVNHITMNIEALTKRGTEINIPLTSTSDMDNDFIVFVNHQAEADTAVVVGYVEEKVEKDRGFSMFLNTDVTPVADVNIYLPMNMGNISSKGSGKVSIGLTPNDFNLRGDYLIESGNFVFTLEMMKRTFTLRKGGTIRWTGDPTDADINVVGVYRAKTSLTSLGPDFADSTSINNNINVDCVIRLSDKLMNPSISFGIELPNATDDVKNMVYYVVDTTNQSVMAQQVFSLMILGSFANTGNADIARLGTNAGYKVVTRQLSNWLSQISKDFDIGIKYTPNDKLTNEELEVALSTQLLDDRLIIEGNFGVIRGDNVNTSNANNLVGDVDITYRMTRRLSLKAYNHTNIKSNYYLYSFENYSDFTQGVGISFSQSFDSIREIFTFNKKNRAKKQKLKNAKPKSK